LELPVSKSPFVKRFDEHCAETSDKVPGNIPKAKKVERSRMDILPSNVLDITYGLSINLNMIDLWNCTFVQALYYTTYVAYKGISGLL